MNNLKNVHENISIMSTANSRLFNDKFAGLWTGIQKYYPKINFYFYHENSFEKNISGEEIIFKNLPKNYHTIDLFESNFWLYEFLRNSPFKDCHLMGKKGIFDDHYFNRNSIYWFRKVAALKDCSERCKTPLLLFLDFDSYITPVGSGYEDECNIDDDYINHVSSFDVCYRSRRDQGLATESGHLIFNLEGKGKQIIEEFLDYYLNGNAFKELRWDDGYIFDKVIDSIKIKMDIREGFLSKRLGAPEDFESIIDHNKGEWVSIRDKYKGI